MRKIGTAILGVTAFAAVTVGALLWSGAVRVPDRWNPWAPIRLADAPNILTAWKLKRLTEDRAQCLAVLETSSFRFSPVEDRVMGLDCHFRNAVRIAGHEPGKGVAYSSGFVAACPLAVGIALFENHALQPAAEAAFGQPVVGVTHYGTYACRNVNNRESGRRSRHATANAIDLAAFRLKDGRQISVERDWEDATDPDREAAFLRDVQDRACGIFGTVLGPEYNAAHHNHFHMDLGGYSICR